MEGTSLVHEQSSQLGIPKISRDTKQNATNGYQEQGDDDSFPGKQNRLNVVDVVEMGSSAKTADALPRYDRTSPQLGP